MTELLFILITATLLGALLLWGFRTLPGERWQIFATIPLKRTADGGWQGLNLTYYGFFSATAYVFATALFLLLTSAIAIPVSLALAVTVTILALAMPAARWVAILVEGKRHTFTVAGAFFVALIAAPPVLWLFNETLAPLLGVRIPFMPTLATMAIAYIIGEGIGRLACISFGCCYGKPLSLAHPWLARLFENRCFVFLGETKKIAYAGGLEGQRVIPIQAITALIYVASGLAAALLFLYSHYLAAFLFALLVSQLWRALSETQRADYRGGGRLSAYQWMSLTATLYALAIALLLSDTPTPAASLDHGLAAIWDPAVLLFLQGLWLTAFLYMGRSSVTQAKVELSVCRERI